MRLDRSASRGIVVTNGFGGLVQPELADLALRLATFDRDVPEYLRASPLLDTRFQVLVSVVEHHRLLGALVEAVECDALPIDIDQRQHLSERHQHWSLNALKVERLLLRTLDCLDRAAIPSRVLKGVALAHTVYPDTSHRVFADVDLLVGGDDIDRAVQIVTAELGGVRTVAELRPNFDREFGKEAMLRVGEVELDLHRTLVAGPFGLTIDLEELMNDSAELVIGGRTVMTLAPTSRYVHACYNVALGDYPVRLGSLRDLLLIDRLAQVDNGLGVAIVETAHRWRATAVVQRAAAIAREALGPAVTPILRELSELRVPARDRVILRTYLSATRGYRRELASLMVVRGFGARRRYIAALVAPSNDYLASRGLTETGHIKRALRRLTGNPDG